MYELLKENAQQCRMCKLDTWMKEEHLPEEAPQSQWLIHMH
jgi:hypothetical protein